MKGYIFGLKYKRTNGVSCELARAGFFLPREVKVKETRGRYRVTGIGAAAFSGNKRLRSVVIPEGVTAIGESAFKGCTNLVRVVLPDGLERIGSGAFSGCASLREIVFPSSLWHVGDEAFFGCAALSEVGLSGVWTVGRRAFGNCVSLTAIDLSSAVDIADEAFLNCKGIAAATPPSESCRVSVTALEGCNKSGLGSLWIGNRYIERLVADAFKDDGELRDGIYELFLELTKREDPCEIREMFRIYREVLDEIAGEGLAHACHASYISGAERESLAKALFEDGYGKALHRVMLGAAQLYSSMAKRVTAVSESGIEGLLRRMNNEPDREEQAGYARERADAFLRMLLLYDPHTGELGKQVPTSSVDFGGFIEYMDEAFNSVYMRIDADASVKVTV